MGFEMKIPGMMKAGKSFVVGDLQELETSSNVNPSKSFKYNNNIPFLIYLITKLFFTGYPKVHLPIFPHHLHKRLTAGFLCIKRE
jgi:hypothetical protein